MTYYPDLSACDYFGSTDVPLVAIGWLENGRDVPTGEVPEQVFEQLRELLREPWGPAFFGWHDCDLCVYRYGPSKLRTHRNTMGFKNVFVPGDAKIYVAPELILHYIDQHGYSPPRRVPAGGARLPDHEIRRVSAGHPQAWPHTQGAETDSAGFRKRARLMIRRLGEANSRSFRTHTRQAEPRLDSNTGRRLLGKLLGRAAGNVQNGSTIPSRILLYCLDRTQEVAGSSPASSIKGLQKQVFCFLGRLQRAPGS
jgi:hypothetical protein